MKTAHCDECRHSLWSYRKDGTPMLRCKLRKKPRFFLPRFADDDYGWKRKCGDYKEEASYERTH